MGSILVLNAGSSSLKFALFDACTPTTGPDAAATMRGQIESLDAAAYLSARGADGALLVERRWAADTTPTFADLLDALLDFTDAQLSPDRLAAVGHRVVHGGRDHVAPERVTPALLAALDALTPLDPLHMPGNLAAIRTLAAARPSLPQVACYDTAFHHDLPLVAQRLALPQAITDGGVRCYGFHGLSYEYIAAHLAASAPRLAAGRVIAAHLGSGASLCALQAGRSIATTFGFSTLDGLIMATRCGSLDPGVILYLARQGHSVAEIEDMLYRRSGLLGMSGISGDIRVLLNSTEARAAQAIDAFCYRIAGHVGALVSALGGLDGLVFTAGIGEHSPAIRADVCRRLAWLGVRLDAAANEAHASLISTAASAIEVRVIATDEQAVIARHTRTVLGLRLAA